MSVHCFRDPEYIEGKTHKEEGTQKRAQWSRDQRFDNDLGHVVAIATNHHAIGPIGEQSLDVRELHPPRCYVLQRKLPSWQARVVQCKTAFCVCQIANMSSNDGKRRKIHDKPKEHSRTSMSRISTYYADAAGSTRRCN